MTESTSHMGRDHAVDRRGFLTRGALTGAGIVWALQGGGLLSTSLAEAARAPEKAGAGGSTADFSFVQITDTHIGFSQPPNTNPTVTFQQAIDQINALATRPAFVIHTGDHVHLSTAQEFDTAKQMMGTIKTDRTFNVPGEHDVFLDQGKQYLQTFGKGAKGSGYFSFDLHGVHFLGLNDVQQADDHGGLTGEGLLGPEQLRFIQRDLRHVSSDTPLVIFAHVPLIPVYLPWGWGVADRAQLYHAVKRFHSVTALNGHVHQIVIKSRGNIVMQTAASTAYPQHRPGVGAPGPLVVPAGVLSTRIGIRNGQFVAGGTEPAIEDQSLGE